MNTDYRRRCKGCNESQERQRQAISKVCGLIEDEKFPTSCSDPYGLLRKKTILGEEVMASLAVTAFGATDSGPRHHRTCGVVGFFRSAIFSAAGNTITKKRNPIVTGYFLCQCFLPTNYGTILRGTNKEAEIEEKSQLFRLGEEEVQKDTSLVDAVISSFDKIIKLIVCVVLDFRFKTNGCCHFF